MQTLRLLSRSGLVRIHAQSKRIGCDRTAEDAYSSAARDPTFAFAGGPCCTTLESVYLLDHDYVLHNVNFAILYSTPKLDLKG
jgi:hypothetical protein